MTPEQRAKINEILKHQDGLDGEYLDLVMTDLNSLTAEIATLRTQLESLVEAGEKGIDAYRALCDVLSDLPTCIEDIVEDYQTHSDNIDALAAAVREAKGEK